MMQRMILLLISQIIIYVAVLLTNSNCDFDLPDNYLCGGLPDKLMIETLKELNIDDLKDFLNHNNDDKIKPFEKQKRAPPPQYHLESSRVDVKDC